MRAATGGAMAGPALVRGGVEHATQTTTIANANPPVTPTAFGIAAPVSFVPNLTLRSPERSTAGRCPTTGTASTPGGSPRSPPSRPRGAPHGRIPGRTDTATAHASAATSGD